jgi:peptidoglycan hydrolase-like protein with peptidoglycan-binding domain
VQRRSTISRSGAFDESTKAAIMFFQGAEHLRVDGKVGKSTLEALLH